MFGNKMTYLTLNSLKFIDISSIVKRPLYAYKVRHSFDILRVSS
jgi:hypothetical protein